MPDSGVDVPAQKGFGGFGEAVGVAVEVLSQRLGVTSWMATRFEGDDLVVLETHGVDRAAAPGATARWCQDLCVRVAEGRADVILTDVTRPRGARSDAPHPLEIRTHVGVPLRLADGSLLGMLCGIDAEPSPATLRDEAPTVMLIGRLLATVFDAEKREADARRNADLLRSAALIDALTGVSNRRSWQHALSREEARCTRHGQTASVVIVDLDNLKIINDRHGHAAGDAILQETARVLQRNVRADDVVARLGGDEFGIIAVQSGPDAAEALRQRLAQALAANNIQASIGVAAREPQGLVAAAHTADLDMYARKAERPGHG